jgi:hypothetical protein
MAWRPRVVRQLNDRSEAYLMLIVDALRPARERIGLEATDAYERRLDEALPASCRVG